MKVLMCPVILGFAWCPGGQGIFERGQARLLGVGVMPKGTGVKGDLILEFLPACNVTLIATWHYRNLEGG